MRKVTVTLAALVLLTIAALSARKLGRDMSKTSGQELTMPLSTHGKTIVFRLTMTPPGSQEIEVIISDDKAS